MSDLHAFVRCLVESVAAHDPASLRAPLPVGEILHRMMPYRACRSPLGLETAEEYELLMLRLIAEEAGLARTWPAESAERCRVEVAAVLPDLAFLRELEDVTVQIDLGVLNQTPGAVSVKAPREPVRQDVPEPAPLPLAVVVTEATREPPQLDDHAEADAEGAESAATVVPELVLETVLADDLEFDENAEGILPDPAAGEETPASDPEPVEDAFDTEELLLPEAPGGAPGAGGEQGSISGGSAVMPSSPDLPAAEPTPIECPHCARTLPRGRTVRFCPSCGQDVRTRRCGACGAELEAEWRHCVMCGQPAGNSSRFA